MSPFMKKKNKEQHVIPWRFYVVLGFAALLFSILALRAAYIQIYAPEKLRAQQDMRTLRLISHQHQRGLILDRNGDLLAASVPLHAIWVDPKFFKTTLDATGQQKWNALAAALEIDKKSALTRIKDQQQRRFLYLKRQVTPALANYITSLKIQGVYSKLESKRFYPGGESIAQLIGITNVDDKGIEGIEQTFDSYLKTTSTTQKVRKSRDGFVIANLDATPAQSHTQNSNHIHLSIDQRIQSLAYAALKQATQETQATSGSIVVLDVKTGEVLAMANTPSFNPNNRQQRQSYRMRNRAITDAFELGSVIKPFIMVAALEVGTLTSESLIDTSPGYLYHKGRRLARDHHNYGKITLETILHKSSNVGVTKVALSMPVQQILSTYSALGIGEASGIKLSGESSGILSFRNRWSKQEQSSLSFGYGFTVTTLQLARMYATLANDGVMMPVSIRKIGDVMPTGTQVISKNVAQTILPMLKGVVDDSGTAKQAHINGYTVAGKTGTSRKAVAGGYGDEYVASFAGVAPLENPRLAIGVVINEPKGEHYYGGDAAAPVFSKVMAGSLQLLNVPPNETKQDMIAQAHTITKGIP